MKVPILDSKGKLHVLDLPRLTFATRDYSYRERAFTFRVLKKPKQPIREMDRVPCWIDIRIPSLWTVYYQHNVHLFGNRYKFFRIPVGYREHYFKTPPKWLLRLIDIYARLRYNFRLPLKFWPCKLRKHMIVYMVTKITPTGIRLEPGDVMRVHGHASGSYACSTCYLRNYEKKNYPKPLASTKTYGISPLITIYPILQQILRNEALWHQEG